MILSGMPRKPPKLAFCVWKETGKPRSGDPLHSAYKLSKCTFGKFLRSHRNNLKAAISILARSHPATKGSLAIHYNRRRHLHRSFCALTATSQFDRPPFFFGSFAPQISTFKPSSFEEICMDCHPPSSDRRHRA